MNFTACSKIEELVELRQTAAPQNGSVKAREIYAKTTGHFMALDGLSCGEHAGIEILVFVISKICSWMFPSLKSIVLAPNSELMLCPSSAPAAIRIGESQLVSRSVVDSGRLRVVYLHRKKWCSKWNTVIVGRFENCPAFMVVGMLPADLEKQIAQAEADLAAGERCLQIQRETIDALEKDGHLANHARHRLTGMEQLQSLYTERRKSLLKDLLQCRDQRPSSTS